MAKVYCIVIEHDSDPDFSWLEQDCYNPRHRDYEPTYHTEEDMKAGRNPIDPDWYRDPDNHVALCMIAYGEPPADYGKQPEVIDSVGGVDFLADSDQWRTGTFYRRRDLPEGYLRELAEEMGLEE